MIVIARFRSIGFTLASQLGRRCLYFRFFPIGLNLHALWSAYSVVVFDGIHCLPSYLLQLFSHRAELQTTEFTDDDGIDHRASQYGDRDVYRLAPAQWSIPSSSVLQPGDKTTGGDLLNTSLVSFDSGGSFNIVVYSDFFAFLR